LTGLPGNFKFHFMIPEEKKTVIATALQAAFGINEFEEIHQLTTGLSSALIFRIVVRGKPYLLRVITRTDAIADPVNYYDSMRAGADAGLAPRVWYAGVTDRISITDFIEAKPFPSKEARTKMPDLLKRLHSLPPFPNRFNYLDRMDGSIRKFMSAGILPETLTGEAFQQYERIRKVYPRDAGDLVSCHNDLKPENILFDGDRAWMVDWEAAFLNDRYTDLAVVANFAVTNDEEEKEFLGRYFGNELSEYHQAKFFLICQVMHMIYFSFFMLLVSGAGKLIDLELAGQDFRSFHDRMWAGEINLADHDARQQYAWAHLAQLRHNLRLQRFEDALQIVAHHQSH
jgi:thiamine kinase-like enzyme